MKKLLVLIIALLLSANNLAMDSKNVISSNDNSGIVSLKMMGINGCKQDTGTGTLVSSPVHHGWSQYVLTNAHCLSNFLGISSFSELTQTDCYEFDDPYNDNEGKGLFVINHTCTKNAFFGEDCWDLIKVKKIILHPEVRNPTSSVDLALLVLEKSVEDKNPFIVEECPIPLEENSICYVDGFGTTGDLGTYPFKLISDRTPRRKEVCCGMTCYTSARSSLDWNYNDANFYRSYFIHEKWECDNDMRNEVITLFNNLQPSKHFAYKGDSGSPLYVLPRKLKGITTFGASLIKSEKDAHNVDLINHGSSVFLNCNEMKIQTNCTYNPDIHIEIPTGYYTPITSEISKWILEVVQ